MPGYLFIRRTLMASATVVGFSIPAAQAETTVRLSGWDLAVFDSLDRPAVDPNAFYEVVPGAIWETDLGTYVFESGTLAFFQEVGGHPSGCFFEGKGTLTFTPPTVIEQGQLSRFCGAPVLNAAVKRAYFRFFGSNVAAGLYAARGQPSEKKPPKRSKLSKFEKWAANDLSIRLAARGWQLLADREMASTFLYAAPDLKGQRRLHFLSDETAEESITLWRHPGGSHAKGVIDLVCSFNLPRSTAELMRRPAVLYGGFDVQSYRSLVQIERSADMILDVELTLSLRRSSRAGWPFSLAPDLEIDTVSVDGVAAQFIYDSDGGWIIVRPAREYETGDTARVRFRYRGDELMYKAIWGDFYISHTTRWLPVGQPRRRTPYETSFRYPKELSLVSVGEKLSDSVEGDWRTTRWRTYEPAAFISFNYGSFERVDFLMYDGPRLEIYRSRNHQRGLFAGDIKKDVAADLEGAIQLFSRAFGPYPWEHLAATEIPGNHGQGFPQLLHLAWYSFETNRKGVTDAFRAHEVAHQWFGHRVGWQSYHDQWLSEGFAEYAGAMYVQAKHRGNKEFFHLLKEWRDLILKTGGHGYWHAGAGVAPIWLGFRCASQKSPASYSQLVYPKGAYVLHMLRQMLYDFRSGSDERFWAMMRDYVSSFTYTDASTADFQEVTERHLGEPMQWFFDQWVYGVQIPRFEYHWEREQQPDGRWIVHGRVNQYDTDSTFRSVMPITLVFREGRTTFRLDVTGPETTFETPPLDTKPRDVVFNDFRTILCRERTVSHP